MLASCGRSAADKIEGWPPREPIVPVRDVVDAPEVEVVEDTAVVDAAPEAEVVREPEACHKIADLVCELEGRFTDVCRDARTNVPDDSHPETREQCAVLFAKFTSDELPRVGSACARYANEVCRDLGAGSEPCKTARSAVGVLTQRRQLRACLGDLLWIQTRTFRR